MINLLKLFVVSFFVTGTLSLPGEKPNVLLIAVDDLNDWIGCLGGHDQTATPNIDRLAERGVLFTNAHSQGTMCNPSRISLLWGRRPSSTGFYDNHYPVKNELEFLQSHVSLPRHFANHGYETLTAGKVFHGGTPEQSQSVGPALGQWLQGLDQVVHEKPDGWHAIWDFGPQDYEESKFVDYVTASWVVQQLTSTKEKPFFLSVGFYRPHVPFFPPSRVYEVLSEVQLPPVKKDDWNALGSLHELAGLLSEGRSFPSWENHQRRLHIRSFRRSACCLQCTVSTRRVQRRRSYVSYLSSHHT
jgi:arylsulfatase A-like enzyme